ncbi:saccharopine dehydrogenase family protein [Sinomicrobium weinanense]|uniref:Saccharopine dehydrogenase NADP-binding domain-containing protein n=1 Tax=Sinomicrobium weinanense TaxID=2842200 RepID=A0A926Q3B3_9FLAO|nr:saccharopine dehydrogenase family protein [Sinomicrobium weinanense]MBC9797437.1 saccharopine dehydrogenase NADP-binding domain-containing protein [Sinomicrobium weinanense]MBU3125455.1 saccharopine dehydrogenase NADP-binding domain-containing protein [Sinomicrobium weinanense]
MKNILIIGVGKSTSYLTQYLSEKAASKDIQITVGDINESSISELERTYDNIKGIRLDIFDRGQREAAVQNADLVISMLPARMHVEVAKDCLAYGKHMVTASYVSAEMQALDEEVKKKGLVFMNEIGLDPGIDHMSAMQVIDRIRDKGGKMLLFESFCGGLVAPESDDNLWNYKFTWNPRNVVVAGQGGAAKFVQEGTYKYIPYNKLFRRTEFLNIEDYGKFEAYANRDSLKYREAYGLEDALTLYRGTMRRVGFSRAWNMFVQLGLTDDSYVMENSENMSYRDYVNAFLPYSPTDSVELKMRHNLKIDQDDIMWNKLEELELFSREKKVGLKNATPAQVLQKILEESWSLKEDDKDMIVMYHKFGYEIDGKKSQIDASMVVIGEDRKLTAMAKTVGLPVAMAALQILDGKINTPGVQIPIRREVYTPILKELEEQGVIFREKEGPYLGYNPHNVAG